MRTYLKDYQPPHFDIEKVHLDIHLQEKKVLIKTRLYFKRKREASPLELQGEGLTLNRVALDGRLLQTDQFEVTPQGLRIFDVREQGVLETEVCLNPDENKALSGLYRAGDMLCTQCEAEGFRRITYYLDRPDVLSRFTTRITASKRQYPVLLSNGNCIERGSDGKEHHWVVWEDPYPKPCYLFALVAGDLMSVRDHYVTMEGRLVELALYLERQHINQGDFALKALKKAMHWDEVKYGRSYDLDRYQIVATQDFNMGAMENKGLNIFNAKYILASPETATDMDYRNIDEVVAHEYFHNWSGNRITCRDWFQLSLKEGLTVFREQQYALDNMQSEAGRIHQANYLRAHQFLEDEGPLAHPVQPESYLEIDNFYTMTVYEKGAEIIRMFHVLLGESLFRRAMDDYFQRFDGQAVTIQDLVGCMSRAADRNWSSFWTWYSQPGTPLVSWQGAYHASKKRYQLTIRQHLKEKQQCWHIPIAVGLLSRRGSVLSETRILELSTAEQTFEWEAISEPPVVSFLRDFSAPIKVIQQSQSHEDLRVLAAHDKDAFVRWDAIQQLWLKAYSELEKEEGAASPDLSFIAPLLEDLEGVDDELRATLLTLPELSVICDRERCIDPLRAHVRLERLERRVALEWGQEWKRHYERLAESEGTYEYTPTAVARRSFKNLCLRYWWMADPEGSLPVLASQALGAGNMTDLFSALATLVHHTPKEASLEAHSLRERTLQNFYKRFSHHPLVLNKWFRVQAMVHSEHTLEVVIQLTEHPLFDWENPNKVYALVLAFCEYNWVGFHRKDGRGYAFWADCVRKVDAFNPQVASRIAKSISAYRRFEKDYQSKMQAQLEQLLLEGRQGRLWSKDVQEVLEACGQAEGRLQ